MLFILKGDKIFEMYGKGEYLNKKNYIEGIWEYDKEVFIIYLYFNKCLVDGVEDII